MPNLDQTGPQGEGPKTGRGLGKCNGNKATVEKTIPNSKTNSPRRGLGQNRRNASADNRPRRFSSK